MHGYLDEHFKTVEYIFQIATQLKLSCLSKASACILYHKCQVEQSKLGEDRLDKYLVAPTCVYLASKLGEEALKIRDIVNISYRVLHPNKAPLEIGTTYWKLRDSITTCELMLLRLFAFNVSFKTPHKYVLHFLKSLEDWSTNYTTWRDSHVSSVCWTLVNDLCYLPLVATTPPDKLAVAVLFIGLRSTKSHVLEEECEEKTWYKVFCPGTTHEELLELSCQILQLYEWKREKDERKKTGDENADAATTSK